METEYQRLLEAIDRNKKEIEHLNNELDLLKNQEGNIPIAEIQKEYINIEKYLNQEKEKLSKNEDILKNYNIVMKLLPEIIKYGEALKTEKDKTIIEEINSDIEKLNKETLTALENLPQELSDELLKKIYSEERLDLNQKSQQQDNTDFEIEDKIDKTLNENDSKTEEKLKQNRVKDNSVSPYFEQKYKPNEQHFDLLGHRKKDLQKSISTIEEYYKIEHNYDKEYHDIIKDIEQDTSLTEDEKTVKIDKKHAEIIDAIDKDKKLKYDEIKEMFKKQANYLKILKDPRDVYKYYKICMKNLISDPEFSKLEQDVYREFLLRNGSIDKIVTSYSELEMEKIEALLFEAKENYNIEALDEASKLIADLPSGEIKQKFQEEAMDINTMINKKNKLDDPENDQGDDPENDQGDDPENDQGDDPENDQGDDPENEPISEIPKIISNKPKVTWKTIVSIAAGIGIGAAVYFTVGPVGITVMGLAGNFAKSFINKKRRDLEKKALIQQLTGKTEVENIEEPRPGIKGKIDKIKKYFNSSEGLRDMSWLINSALITGTTLSVASFIQNLLHPVTPNPTPKPDPVPTPKPDPVPTPNPNIDKITIDKIYDSASWATNGIHAENPLSYINSAEGSVISKIQNGAALITKGGVAQGWIPADGVKVGDLVDVALNIGGKSR